MVACDLKQFPAFLNECGRNPIGLFPVVVSGTTRDETSVERRTDHKGYVLGPGSGEHLVQRVLVVDQRVLRSQKTYIRIGNFQQPHDRFRRVDTDPPSLDQALLAHACQFEERALLSYRKLFLPWSWKIFVVGRDVVYERDVD